MKIALIAVAVLSVIVGIAIDDLVFGIGCALILTFACSAYNCINE